MRPACGSGGESSTSRHEIPEIAHLSAASLRCNLWVGVAQLHTGAAAYKAVWHRPRCIPNAFGRCKHDIMDARLTSDCIL